MAKAPSAPIGKPTVKAGTKPVQRPSAQTAGEATGKPVPVRKAPVATPVSAPSFEIVEQHDRMSFLNMLVYGDHGVGKTYLLGTCVDVPLMRDVLLLNAEGGDLTYQSKEHEFALIDSIRATNFKTVSKVHEFLLAHCRLRDADDIDKLRALEARLKDKDPKEIKEPRQYRTVIIDSLTEVEQYCMNTVLGINPNLELDNIPTSAEWAEYKKNHSMIQRFVRSFRDLPMNVLFTCARDYTQDENKKYQYSPSMTGKLSRQIQGFMDVVGYYVATPSEDGKCMTRRLWVQPVDRRFSAKCRFSQFKGTHFDNPTIPSILEAVGMRSDAPKVAAKPKVKQKAKAT